MIPNNCYVQQIEPFDFDEKLQLNPEFRKMRNLKKGNLLEFQHYCSQNQEGLDTLRPSEKKIQLTSISKFPRENRDIFEAVSKLDGYYMKLYQSDFLITSKTRQHCIELPLLSSNFVITYNSAWFERFRTQNDIKFLQCGQKLLWILQRRQKNLQGIKQFCMDLKELENPMHQYIFYSRFVQNNHKVSVKRKCFISIIQNDSLTILRDIFQMLYFVGPSYKALDLTELEFAYSKYLIQSKSERIEINLIFEQLLFNHERTFYDALDLLQAYIQYYKKNQFHPFLIVDNYQEKLLLKSENKEFYQAILNSFENYIIGTSEKILQKNKIIINSRFSAQEALSFTSSRLSINNFESSNQNSEMLLKDKIYKEMEREALLSSKVAEDAVLPDKTKGQYQAEHNFRKICSLESERLNLPSIQMKKQGQDKKGKNKFESDVMQKSSSDKQEQQKKK